MVRFKTLFIFALTILLLSSCVDRKKTIYLSSRGNSPEVMDHPKTAVRYKVKPGDMLYVKIMSINNDINDLFNVESSQSPNTTTSQASFYLKGFTVSDSGYIRLPIIDSVKVSGISLLEAESKIQTEVNKYFKNSTLIVKLLNFKISVLGEVNRPGTFDIYQQDITVFEAIAQAGGVKDFANNSEVLIIRSLENKNQTFRINMCDINLMNSDKLYLMPNDVLIVEPLKSKNFRTMDAPNISLALSALTTMILVLNFVLK